MPKSNWVEPCDGCKLADTCQVPPALAHVVHAWNAPDAIFDFPFVEVLSSWRQDDALLIKLQCRRYKSKRPSIFVY